MKKLGKTAFRRIVFAGLILVALIFGYFFVGNPTQAKEIKWGVNFSQKHSQALGLDWKKNYLALLDELGARNLKVASYWDLLEAEKDNYNFEDLDWQVQKAEEKGANLLLIIGMKTGRWPECSIPAWAEALPKEDQQAQILELLEKIVLKYRDSSAVVMWQVENEPLFPFGECPWRDKNFLKKEVELVKSLDNLRLVVISDSGEWSMWFRAAGLGDVVGTTMYQKVWFKEFKIYGSYPLPPVFYWRKAELVKQLFNKEVIVVELQAEPWCPNLLYDCSLREQEETMDLAQFKKSVEFAEKTGLKEFYLWGGEWWYWLKEKQERPEIWEEAKKLLKGN